ncbi:MAG: AlpA family phage regulatory protein [Hyphomicrobiales bacterium]
MVAQLLSTKSVIEVTSLSRTTLWRKVQAGEFPSPVQLTAARVGYLADEVDLWINDRVNSHRNLISGGFRE